MYPDAQHILVIDNQAERRNLCEQVLVEAGFAVTAVADSLTAIRAVTGCRFALALAAIELPGTVDGPTVVRQIRARQPWLRALFTGNVAQRPFLRGRGSDDFIVSPFRRRDLLGCVFELLHRHIPPADELPNYSRAG